MALPEVSFYFMLFVLHSATDDQIKGLGRWDKNQFKMSYLTGIPFGALLMAAGYSDHVRHHHLPRSTVIPPKALTDAVLPWVEHDHQVVAARNKSSTNKDDRDMSVEGFLETLLWLKVVFLQDMALLCEKNPSLPVINHEVFKFAEWIPFAEEVRRVVANYKVSDNQKGKTLKIVAMQ